jgi:3-oxoacyl-[acyl-carrier-protein] synthase II
METSTLSIVSLGSLVRKNIFVTGLGAVTPIGLDCASTWTSLVKGQSGIDYITSFDTTGFESTFAAEVKGFDPYRLIDRKNGRRMDRFVQLAVTATHEALDMAHLSLADVDRTRVSTIVGSGIGGIMTLSQQLNILHERGPSRISPFLIPMMLPDTASSQISMVYGIKGPNYCTVSACSSGSDAIGLALAMLRDGSVDIVLAGGAEAPICPVGVGGFNACQALSRRNNNPKSASRPFDRNRDGFVLAEGAAILVLETEESLLRRGVIPLAKLTGYGASSDAYHMTQPSPDGEGAARAISLSLEDAGLEPHEIDYVNAHGTSTPLNDKFETIALKKVFGSHVYKVRISSTKSMTGHLLGAAGALEAAICVMSIRDGAVPPTINLNDPDPECDLDYTPNVAYHGPVVTAMSNSLGFGGHNSSLIFQSVDNLS